MATVLGIGNATLDIVNTVAHYPGEDDEIRALSQRRCLGGNCANTLTVLRQLGHHCAFAGVFADDPGGLFIAQELQRQGINIKHCRTAKGTAPTSYVTLSQATGSRTIIHYRDLPEFSFADFAPMELTPFDWVHFEGRNIPETTRMLALIATQFPALPRSVEIEKPRTGIEALFQGATLLLFSRPYVNHCGYTEAQPFLQELHLKLPGTDKVCLWGQEGAYAISHTGEIYHAPAFTPSPIMDTLGAGDTFNAGFIDARLRRLPLAESLRLACQLAGHKCSQYGLGHLDKGRG
jgi:ketohexokinase